MYIPPQINDRFLFPTGDQNKDIILPKLDDVKIGDIIIARYNHSRWTRILPWEEWHHAALISNINPLTIIESVGPNSANQPEGPTEVQFSKSVGIGKAKDIKEIRWLKPVFPNPIREIGLKTTLISKRKIINETEARKRVIAYARQQLGEPYSFKVSKHNESSWYCSLIVYKSYSRAITGMYLENYDDIRAGFLVTPEDILNSKRTKKYFTWKYIKNTWA